MNFHVLPSLVALAILVVVFRAILRQGAAERLQLWLTAWILVLIHFVAAYTDVGHGLWDHVASAISLGALELASISFLISMSPGAKDQRPSVPAWSNSRSPRTVLHNCSGLAAERARILLRGCDGGIRCHFAAGLEVVQQ